jgi:hypothetical protein
MTEYKVSKNFFANLINHQQPDPISILGFIADKSLWKQQPLVEGNFSPA